MKNLVLFVIVAISLTAAGCATSSYSVGRDFSTENVNKILKGKTTGNDLLQMFGEPFSKTVLSETEEKWLYTYSSGTASAQSYVFTMKVESTGRQKTLDILLKNGVVTNFTFTDGPGLTSTVQ